MKYDLKTHSDREKLMNRVIKLVTDKKDVVELIKPKETRSISQNSYLHAIISIYAIEFGYTLEEAKTMLKRGCEFMRYKQKNNWFLKKSSKLDEAEMALWITWIRNYAAQNGLYILTAEEYKDNYVGIDNEIKKHSQYL